MKTPRLALFAILACASAANAALPTWTVTDESFRAWPTITFNAGHGARSLRCRLAECDPTKNKGTSKLYVMRQTGANEPIKATITELHPLGRNDPRRWFGKEYDEVKRVIDSHRTRFTTELSDYTLDNSGAQLVVVQGNNRFPASTDINQQYWSATGAVIAVNPPAKMADDAPKPYGPPAPPNTGNPATAKWWCDPATGEKYSAVRGRRGSTLLASRDAVCRKTSTTTPPPPVVVTPPPAETVASLALLPGDETRWLTKRQAAAYASARAAAKDGAARKAADDQYRALVEAQTRPEAQAAYKTARALPVAQSSAALKAAVGAVVMWGGKDAKDVTAIVEPFQAAASSATAKLLEIQLSKAEWDLLKKSTANLTAYTNSRMGTDGDNGDRTFNKEYVDPVALRLSVAAARVAVGGSPNPTTPAGPEGPALDQVNLTPEQRKLLSPDELTKYEGQERAAAQPNASKETKEALYRLNAEYKELIKTRKPYVQPTDAASFAKLEDWQKKRFCAGLPSPSAVAQADTKDAFVGNVGADANQGLGNQSGQVAVTPGATTTAGKAWSKEESEDACKKFKETLATTPAVTPGSGRGSLGGSVPTPTGVAVGDDKETKEKEKSKWLTQDLVLSAVKGGMIGLLVGSLFGPVGLIAGPIIGAAISYGLTKITTKE